MAFDDLRTNFDDFAGNIWNIYSGRKDINDKLKSEGYKTHLQDFIDTHKETRDLSDEQKKELFDELDAFAKKRLGETED